MGEAAVIREKIERLQRQADAVESSECTGLAATWCPVHGTCLCPERENALDHPGCPLHAPTSNHATPQDEDDLKRLYQRRRP